MSLLDMLSDPTTQFGASLLAGQSPFAGVNIGSALLQTGQLQQAQQKEQRAQQQAEVSQLIGTYKVLKDQDQQARTSALLTGQEYTPNPLMQQFEQKLSQVMGTPMQSQRSMAPTFQPGSASQMPQGMPQGAPQAPAQAPMGQGAPQAQATPQAPPQAPNQTQAALPALLQGAGITPAMAALWSQSEKGVEQMMAKLQEAYGPRVVNNLLMQMQPGGATKILGGAITGDVTPVVNGASGPEVLPIKGLQETRAAQAGATTDATEAAKSKYEMISVPQADGSTVMVPKAFALNMKPGTGAVIPTGSPQVASSVVTQPPAVGSGATFGVSQTPGAKAQQEGLVKSGVDYKTNLDNTVNVGNDLMMRINESKKALEQFKPGMGADARMQAARFAQAIHLPDSVVNLINDGNVAAKQEFQKLAAQQAMESLKQALGGNGRITQAEFKVFQAANPNIELDPDAISKIFKFAQDVQAKNVAQQSALSDYLGKGGDITKWPTIWSQQQAASGYSTGAKADPLGIRK